MILFNFFWKHITISYSNPKFNESSNALRSGFQFVFPGGHLLENVKGFWHF